MMTPTGQPIRLLLIEDNPGDCLLVKEALAECGSNIHFSCEHSLQAGLASLSANPFDLALVDLGLPESQGLETLHTLVDFCPQIPVIILTGLADTQLAIEALSTGAQDYLVKGNFDSHALDRSIRYSLARKEAEQRVRAMEAQLENLSRSARDAIFVIDQRSDIVWANDAAESLLRQRGRLTDQRLSSFFDDASAAELLQQLQQESAGANDESTVIDARLEPSFQTTIINYSLSHWPSESGRFHYSLIARDVTQIRKNEAIIKMALEAQKAAASIHDLRTASKSLQRKLESALQALASVSWIGNDNLQGAAIYLSCSGQEPTMAAVGENLSKDECASAAKQPTERNADKNAPLNERGAKAAAGSYYDIRLMDESARSLLALKFHTDTPWPGATEEDEHLQMLLGVLGALIDDHLQHTRIAQLSRAVEQSPIGTVITDSDGAILFANEAALAMTGYCLEEVVGQNPRLFQSNETSMETYRELWKTISNGKVWRGEIRNRRKDGTIYWESQVVAPVLDADNRPINFTAIKEDIQQRKQSEAQLHKMATHDNLTGLANRVLLLDRLAQALGQVRRYGHGVAVVLLDLDNFKLVNDQQGHLTGDRVLREVGLRLTSLLRETDTVGRQGGDEFILILPETGNREDLEKMLNRYLVSLAKPYFIDDYTANISCSVGVALCDDGSLEADELYRRADVAMYEAKKRGGNQYCFFNPQLDTYLNDRIWFRDAIKRALTERQFVLFFQPQISINTGRVIGAEALIRWQNPEKGLIQPDEFISMTEESGDIIGIGDWVLEESCRQLQQWQQEGFHLPRLSINLSARQLYNEQLVPRMIDCLNRFGIRPSQLEVELTESQIMQSPEFAIKTLQQLRSSGVLVSGDDFGTGYSSLSYLKRLPFSRLKIDRSFITDVITDDESQAIASMIISLGQTLGLKVLAEGVEEPEQLDLLRRLGCDEFQGYLCTPPLPAQAFVDLCTAGGLLISVQDDLGIAVGR